MSRSLEQYAALAASMQILEEWKPAIATAKAALVRLKPRYDCFCVPWEILAVLHMRECSNSFDRQLLNGEPWNQKTTMVPVGVGPFDSWKDSMWYAIVKHGINTLSDAPLEEILQYIEQWNGWGYLAKGKQSPYLWSGSNHGVGVGKYVGDGVYNVTEVDDQLGAAVIYLALKNEIATTTIKFGDKDDDVLALQKLLNHLGSGIKEDGDFGPATAKAFQQVFGVSVPQ